jgi:hypothetical protein
VLGCRLARDVQLGGKVGRGSRAVVEQELDDGPSGRIGQGPEQSVARAI